MNVFCYDKVMWKGLFSGKQGQTQDSSGWLKESDRNDNLTLTDADYEFLWSQLLEGVSHGWDAGRVVRFFAKLEDRGKQDLWVKWLDRYEEKLLKASNLDVTTAAKMVQLGEITRSYLPVQKIASKAYDIGSQILSQQMGQTVWEYEGPDTSITLDVPEFTLVDTPNQFVPPSPVSETVTPPPRENSPIANLEGVINAEESDPWGEVESSENTPQNTPENAIDEGFLDHLKGDPDLVQHLSQQLGVAPDPQVIVEALAQQGKQVWVPGNPLPEPTEQQLQDIEILFQKGIESIESQKFEEAIEHWEKALGIYPHLPQLWHNRGSALGQLQRYEDALVSFEIAIQLSPDNAPAWNDRGNALFQLHRWQEAIESWDKTLAINPNNYLTWYNRGVAYEQLYLFAEALESYQKLLTLQPDFAPAQERCQELEKALSEEKNA